MEADKARGAWIDPRGADMPLAAWVEEFLLLARRLSPTTVQTYRRDLDRGSTLAGDPWPPAR